MCSSSYGSILHRLCVRLVCHDVATSTWSCTPAQSWPREVFGLVSCWRTHEEGTSSVIKSSLCRWAWYNAVSMATCQCFIFFFLPQVNLLLKQFVKRQLFLYSQGSDSSTVTSVSSEMDLLGLAGKTLFVSEKVCYLLSVIGGIPYSRWINSKIRYRGQRVK